MKKERRIKRALESFEAYLKREEKSPATQEKYLQIARGFLNYAKGEVSRDAAIGYKGQLIAESTYVRFFK